MLRATWFTLAVLCGAALFAVTSFAAPQRVNLINGIGLIDYSRPQKFKIGSWVKYRVTGHSEMGMSDDYLVTILIGGEEKFWGEDCFWVETWTEPKDGPPNSIASLMSYAIFDDSSAVTNMQLYSRKLISEVDDKTGAPIQVVSKRNSGSLKNRRSPKERLTIKVDTLGTESVTVPKGTYQTVKVSLEQGLGSTADIGDSSQRTEVRESRVTFMSKNIPITGIAREDIDNTIQRRTWKIGQSGETPLNMVEHSHGSAMLVDYGVGLTPQLVPEKFRKPIASTSTAKAAPAKTTPAKSPPAKSTSSTKKAG